MSANQVTEAFSGAASEVVWRLKDWARMKEVHVIGSTCDVTVAMPTGGLARVRYGLTWTTDKHTTHIHVKSERVTKYLGLTVEPLEWPNRNNFLQVHLSWNRSHRTGAHGVGGYGISGYGIGGYGTQQLCSNPQWVHPVQFCTCVRLDPNGVGVGKQVTVFDTIIPDSTWDIEANGEHKLHNIVSDTPLPIGQDLCFTITSSVVGSKTVSE